MHPRNESNMVTELAFARPLAMSACLRGEHWSCYPIPEMLGRATGTQPKSLIRMFSARGNPQARNLFSVIGYLQKRAGVELHVHPT
jgi:hypothetical protein